MLLLGSLALFSANMGALSLPSLDDCFYARKGVEMARSGSAFSVTWNGRPAFQNPPLQIWLLARSFALFGESDFAARLPSLLMALGIVAGTYRIGRHLLGDAEALCGAGLLLLSPYFVNNARRCMMEVPLTLWVVAALLIVLEGQRRPRLHALLALPLGAAILTKSVLGLLPLLVLVPAGLSIPPLRSSLARPWLWLGIAGGLALGVSWPIHQAATFGWDAVRSHYVGEVAARATAGSRPLAALTDYPLILLRSFEPAVLAAVPGLVLLFREWRARREDPSILLLSWIAIPLLLYSASSARSARYVFPLFPALALCGGCWLARRTPQLARSLRHGLVPVVLVAGTLVFWIRPTLLTKSDTLAFKSQSAMIRERIPAGEPLTYLGDRFWSRANPLLYYAERVLDATAASAEAAARACQARSSHLLLTEQERKGEVVATGGTWKTLIDGGGWVLLERKGG